MAEAKTTFSPTEVWDDGKRVHAVGKLITTGGPDTYTTGGIAFDVIANALDTAGLGIPLPTVQQQPFWANIVGSSYFAQYLPATKKLVYKVVVGGAEVAAGAIPAGLTSDTVIAYFIFRKF